MVTFDRSYLFGDVVAGEMRVSALGKIDWDEWMRSVQIRKEVRLFEDEFVVMTIMCMGLCGWWRGMAGWWGGESLG